MKRAQDRIQVKTAKFEFREMFKTVHSCQFLFKLVGRNARNSFSSFGIELSARIFEISVRKIQKSLTKSLILDILGFFWRFSKITDFVRKFWIFLVPLSQIGADSSIWNEARHVLAFLPSDLNKNWQLWTVFNTTRSWSQVGMSGENLNVFKGKRLC